MSNILDDIFTSAAQQNSAGATVQLNVSITTNNRGSTNPLESEFTNFATYADTFGPLGSPLVYSSTKQSLEFGASGGAFTGGNLIRYFSNNRYGGVGLDANRLYPFNPQQTDPLNISISVEHVLVFEHPTETSYTVAINSSTDLNGSFTPNVDSESSIITGVLGTSFVTVSICGLSITTPPK